MTRIYLDIETCPLTAYTWAIGRKISLSYENILEERKVICICWKVDGKSKVWSLQWKKQSDLEMLTQFAAVMAEADELCGHNIKGFDLPILKARCAFHGIQTLPKYSIIDTLSLARQNFKFASNRLDYLGKFLGVGKKTETGGFGLWKSVMQNSEPALSKMIRYCKADVELVQKVHHRILASCPHHTHSAVLNGGERWQCPRCESEKVKVSKTRITASGTKQYQMACGSCGGYYSISGAVHEQYLASKLSNLRPRHP